MNSCSLSQIIRFAYVISMAPPAPYSVNDIFHCAIRITVYFEDIIIEIKLYCWIAILNGILYCRNMETVGESATLIFNN